MNYRTINLKFFNPLKRVQQTWEIPIKRHTVETEIGLSCLFSGKRQPCLTQGFKVKRYGRFTKREGFKHYRAGKFPIFIGFVPYHPYHIHSSWVSQCFKHFDANIVILILLFDSHETILSQDRKMSRKKFYEIFRQKYYFTSLFLPSVFTSQFSSQ